MSSGNAMIKKGFILGLVLAFSLVLKACSGADDDVLRIALDIEDRDRYDELFDHYTEETGTEIRATYGEDINKLIGTRDEPDILKTSTVVVASMKDSLLDISPYVESDDTIDPDMYIESLMDALEIDGKIYALPTSVNTSLLYYNKDMFDEKEDEIREALGLSEDKSVYPQRDWTYEEYQKAGVALSEYTMDGNGDPDYSQFGAETQLRWWGEWLVYVYQHGGRFYKEGSNNRECALDSPEALEATEFFVEKSMGGPDEKFAPDAIEADSSFSFMSESAAMIFGGHMGDWHSYEALGLNWDVEMLPTPDGNPGAKGGEIASDAFGISVRSDKPDAAYEFLKMWAGEEGALQMYEYGKVGALKNMEALIKDLPESEQKDINIDAVFDAMEIARTLPEERDFSKVMREMVMSELYKLLYEGRGARTDIEETLSDIKQDVDEYYDNLYD